MDGDNATDGNRGYRADFQVSEADEDQGLNAAIYKGLTLKPVVSTNPAKAVLVNGSGTLTYAIPELTGRATRLVGEAHPRRSELCSR